jgi:hypothetical protein
VPSTIDGLVNGVDKLLPDVDPIGSNSLEQHALPGHRRRQERRALARYCAMIGIVFQGVSRLESRHLQSDFQLTKQFPIKESVRMELRAEVFNIFNHAQFGNPDGNLADGASFGRISRIHGLPRIAQLAAKFYF